MDAHRRIRPWVHALSGLMLVLALVPAPAARSAPVILRCTAPGGTSVYTDHACASSGARPAPMSPALVARLLSEARIAHAQGADAALPLGAGTEPLPADIPRRPAADGCARTPRQLAADLRGSLAIGDVNRLAESYHWVGMRARDGQRTLGRLARLLGRRAVDSQYYAAQIASLSDNDTRGGEGGILQLVLAGQGAPSIVEFDVHRYAGCYFVRFPADGATIA